MVCLPGPVISGVCSIRTLLLVQQVRQPCRYLREYEEQHAHERQGQQERIDTAVNDAEGRFRDVLHDEDVDRHGRVSRRPP